MVEMMLKNEFEMAITREGAGASQMLFIKSETG